MVAPGLTLALGVPIERALVIGPQLHACATALLMQRIIDEAAAGGATETELAWLYEKKAAGMAALKANAEAVLAGCFQSELGAIRGGRLILIQTGR